MHRVWGGSWWAFIACNDSTTSASVRLSTTRAPCLLRSSCSTSRTSHVARLGALRLAVGLQQPVGLLRGPCRCDGRPGLHGTCSSACGSRPDAGTAGTSPSGDSVGSVVPVRDARTTPARLPARASAATRLRAYGPVDGARGAGRPSRGDRRGCHPGRREHVGRTHPAARSGAGDLGQVHPVMRPQLAHCGRVVRLVGQRCSGWCAGAGAACTTSCARLRPPTPVPRTAHADLSGLVGRGLVQVEGRGERRGHLRVTGQAEDRRRDDEQAKAEHLTRIGQGQTDSRDDATVGAWLEQWLEDEVDLRGTTLRSYEGHLRLYLVPHVGHVRPPATQRRPRGRGGHRGARPACTPRAHRRS